MTDKLDRVLAIFEERTKAVPVGHEIVSRGASTYNWRVCHLDELREIALSLDAPPAAATIPVITKEMIDAGVDAAPPDMDRSDVGDIIAAALFAAPAPATGGEMVTLIERLQAPVPQGTPLSVCRLLDEAADALATAKAPTP